MKLLIVVVISILLAGCQNAAFSDPESPYYRFARATKVVVNRDVSIGPNRTSVWFQNGRILSGANEFYPYCRMYVYGTVNETRIVKPAEYAVKRWLRERLLVWHDGNPLMYASIMSSGGEQPSHVTWGVYFYLEGSGASQPRLLMCGQLGDWASGASRGYPTFAEMREALGSFVSIVER